MLTANRKTKARPMGRVFACGGFTTVELIVTIVVLGIIATVAGARFFSANQFNEMGFADASANALRYAHKLALSSGCDTRVQVTSTAIGLYQRATDCDSGSLTRVVKRPGGSDFVETVPAGVSVSALDIYFDSRGRPYSHASASLLSSAASLSIGSRSLSIEAETGYVH